MPEDAVSETKRISQRRKVLKEGKIVSLDYNTVIDCIVKDVSETGARIKCIHQSAIPDEFRLLMPGDETIREARVMWRRGDLIGLRFTGDVKKAPPRRW